MLNFRRLQLAVLVMAGLYVSSAASRAVDVRLLPSNTEVVFTVNIKQMLNSEMARANKEVIAQMKGALDNPQAAEAMKYLKDMGFEPFSDLTSITVAHTGSQEIKDLFVVIDGAFKADKFHAVAAKVAEDNAGIMRTSKFGTTTIYEIQGGPEMAFLALVGGKSVVVAADLDVLKGAITRSTGTTVVATKVVDLLRTVNDKQSLSIAITGEALGRAVANVPNAGNLPIGNVVESIKGITGAITMAKDINFQLAIGTADEKSAKELVTTGQLGLVFLNGMVANKAKDNPDLAPAVEVMRTLKLSSMGSNAVLNGTISQANLEKLMKALGNQ
jgi:hypothetical protein